MSQPDTPAATDVAVGTDGLEVDEGAQAEGERQPLTAADAAQRDDLLVSPEES